MFVISLVFTSHAAEKLAHDWGSWSSIWCVVACVESNSSWSLLVACCLSKMSHHHPFFIPHFTVCVPGSQRAETGDYRGLNHATQTRTVNKSLLSSAKVAWRMLINWTGWPCVGQKEPWDTETQQNWHWKQTEKKMKGSNGEKKHGGGQRNKYLISSRGCSVHIYSKKKHEKNWKKRWDRAEKKGEWGRMDGRTNGWTERRDLESTKTNYPARLLGGTGRGSDASY